MKFSRTKIIRSIERIEETREGQMAAYRRPMCEIEAVNKLALLLSNTSLRSDGQVPYPEDEWDAERWGEWCPENVSNRVLEELRFNMRAAHDLPSQQ